MSESDTQTIDEKKNKTSDAPNVDIKPGQFGQFVWQFVLFCLWLIAFWILGSCVLFQCKVAQSNILPTDINAFPYTDTEPVFGYTKDNHDSDETINKFYVNIFKFFEGGKEQNMKLFFDYYLQNDKDKFINQDLYLNGRASRIDPKSGWFTMYTTSLFQGVTSFCFSRYSQVFQLMNVVLNERAMLILGPFIMAYAFFVITGLNFIYLFWLYFKNMNWFFMEKDDTLSNDGGYDTPGEDRSAGNLIDLRQGAPPIKPAGTNEPLDFRKKSDELNKVPTSPIDIEMRNLETNPSFGKNPKPSIEMINTATRGGGETEGTPDIGKKRAKWKTNYGFSGMLCVFLNLFGLYGLYPVIFGILSFYTSVSCWVTTLLYSCKIKDDKSQETIGFSRILMKNLLYQIPTFAILFMLWLPQASWKTLGPYGLVCSIIVILMLMFGALFYKSDDQTTDGKKKEQSYNLKDIFKTIPQHPISPDSNYDPITRTYEDKEWNADGFSAGQSWVEWFIETWNYLNGKKTTGKKADDDVKAVTTNDDGSMKMTTVGEINSLDNTPENNAYLNKIISEYDAKLKNVSGKKGQINIIKKEEYNSIIDAANAALTKFNKPGSSESSAPPENSVVPATRETGKDDSRKFEKLTDKAKRLGWTPEQLKDEITMDHMDDMTKDRFSGGSVKEFDRAVRRLKRVLKGV
jgi:hypothetical protein